MRNLIIATTAAGAQIPYGRWCTMAAAAKATGSMLVPPANFAMVEDGVYRSAYPTEANVSYLRHIGITHVVLLSIESLPGPVKRLLASEVSGKMVLDCTTRGPIRLVNVTDMRTWRVDVMNSGDDFSRRDVIRALDFAVDRRWHPVLFTCPLGELQTSVLMGCMRRYQYWALSSILSECELFCSVCRKLRSSVMVIIENWDPDSFPISAVNVQYRNREMHQRDRTRAHQERCRHRRAAATLAKNCKTDLSDSAAASDEELEEIEEDEDDAYEVAETHSTVSDRVSMPEARMSSGKSSPQKSYSETSGTNTPPALELKCTNPEAALISTSGQRPPAGLRRTANQRWRTQQAASEALKDTTPLLQAVHVAQGRELGVTWAEWYLEALRVREDLRPHTRSMNAMAASSGAGEEEFGAALPPPHVRYADIRNPPAVDARSQFTKESIVEEDDD